jgi:uncharacterized protein DUF5907/copper-binding protein NosD/parallel beta helix pectate lyase-like protein
MQPSEEITLSVDLSDLSTGSSVNSTMVSQQTAVAAALISGPRGDDGAAGPGLPNGGTTGQFVVKASETDYDYGLTIINKATVGLDLVDNTADINKPVSTATQTALDTLNSGVVHKTGAETINGAKTFAQDILLAQGKSLAFNNLDTTSAGYIYNNASAGQNLLRSDNKFSFTQGITLPAPSTGTDGTNKTYVDALVSGVSSTVVGKEDVANKSNSTSLGASSTLYPTQNAVKTYVDAQVSSATIVDATTVVKGKLQLSGDLSGTATAPTTKSRGFTRTVGQTGMAADYIYTGTGDQAAVNSAINDVNAAGGGTVQLRGNLSTNGSIILKSNVRLVADGPVTITGSSTDYRLIYTVLSGTTKTVYNNIHIEGITLVSNYGNCILINNTDDVRIINCETSFNSPTGASPIRQAIYIQHCRNVVVQGCYVHDLTGNGISLTSTDYGVINGNIVNGGAYADDCIDVDYDFSDTSAIRSYHITVTNNVVTGDGRGNAIRIENASYWTVGNNDVSNVTTDGGAGIKIIASNGGTTLTDGVVNGNNVYNCLTDGINVQGATLSRTLVSNNNVYLCGQAGGTNQRAGINLNAANLTCIGNTVDTCGKSGADGGGILINRNDGQFISGNRVSNCPTGVRAWNGDSLQSYASCVVTNNYYQGNTTDEALTAFTNTSRVGGSYGYTTYTGSLNQSVVSSGITTQPVTDILFGPDTNISRKFKTKGQGRELHSPGTDVANFFGITNAAETLNLFNVDTLNNRFGLGYTEAATNAVVTSGAVTTTNTSSVQMFGSTGFTLHKLNDINFTLSGFHCMVEFSAQTVARTITLPSSSGNAGRIYIIKDGLGTAATNNINIATTSSQTIDGQTSLVINKNYGYVVIYSAGGTWKIWSGDYNSALPDSKSRIIGAVVGKTTGDFPVSNYTDTTNKSAFQQALEAAFLSSQTVLIRNSATPYTMKSAHSMATGQTLLGESEQGVILQMNSGRNATIITNADASTGFTTDVTIMNLTLDQQGTLQTAGGGIVTTGIQRWHIENVTIKKSFRFNFLCLSQAAGTTTKTGTTTFTNGSEVVTGVGTLFTTELAVGDIIKSAGGQFVRVAKINSNTEFLSTIPWGYTTESAVTFRVIQPNSYNYFRNVKYQGTVDSSDASGYGFADFSKVVDCVSSGASAAGCGFVPDHARGMQFINCTAHDNENSGFSYETCEDILTQGGETFRNGNGYQLISGSTRCSVDNLNSHDNVSHGFSTSYNILGAPVSDENTFSNCKGYNNGGYGLRIDGSHRNQVIGGRYYNNALGGAILNVANSRIPFLNTFSDVKFYDTRTTKIQPRGLYIVSADQTKVVNVEARDADHATVGIQDGGTGTAITSRLNGNYGVGTNTPGNQLSIGTPTTADSLPKIMVAGGTGTSKGVVVQAQGSTGNLLEFQSSAGNVFMNVTSGGILRLPTGTAGAPSLGFTVDGSTGFYRPAVANTIRITTGANDRFQIDNNRTTFMHGMQFKRIAVSLNYTIGQGDYLIAYTALAAPRTVTLPTAVGVENQQYIVKDESGNAATNNITVATTSGQTIDGAANKIINSNYQSYTFYSDGANWFVL